MPTRLVNLVVAAADPAVLAAFWSRQLGWELVRIAPGEYGVRPSASDGCDIALALAAVPDDKDGHNRIHLDLWSASAADQQERVARARAAGARNVDIGQRRVPWVVLADPEGNELCIREPSRHYVGTGAVAAILVDAADPDSMGRFWAHASGWVRSDNAEGSVSLRAPGGRGPWLEFWPQIEPKDGKNRLHLDVAPSAGGGVDTEVRRLVALGAEPVDIGQGDVPWVVLADPEGNEFCVRTPRSPGVASGP